MVPLAGAGDDVGNDHAVCLDGGAGHEDASLAISGCHLDGAGINGSASLAISGCHLDGAGINGNASLAICGCRLDGAGFDGSASLAVCGCCGAGVNVNLDQASLVVSGKVDFFLVVDGGEF